MAEITRQMTQRERDDLAEQLRVARLRSHPLTEVFLFLVGAALLSLFAGGLWMIGLMLFGILKRGANWTENTFAIYGIAAITILVFSMALFDLLRRAGSRQKTIARIRDDLAAGIVLEDHLSVVAAKSFVEPEHMMRLYFLLGDDGRVFTLFDYDSVNLDGGERSKPTSLRFAKDMTIKRFPRSSIVDYSFSGTPIRKPRALPLTARPENWPEAEAFCDVPWGEIEKSFAA